MRVIGGHFCQVYAAVLSTALAVLFLMGAKAPRIQTFDEIQVHRINLVEPAERCEW